jgi:hypothetical protein
MSPIRRFFAVALLLSCVPLSLAYASGPRQFYSGWQKHPRHNYFVRNYHFKPRPTFSGYRHHHVLFFPNKPTHVYFYNPHKKQFWGRCPVGQQGEGKYSLLAEKDRKGSLSEIPESAFPEPGPVPTIPEAEDKEPLDLPPDDLPFEFELERLPTS